LTGPAAVRRTFSRTVRCWTGQMTCRSWLMPWGSGSSRSAVTHLADRTLPHAPTSYRVTSAAIVAGISPLSFGGATRGMPTPVRLVLWLGGRAPVLTRPYVSLMARMVKKPDTIAKGIGSLLPDDELALLDTPRFDGFFENFDEMVKHGSEGAYWDARVFLGEWGFDCADIEMPVSLFYGTDDQNVPIQMGEYYRDAIPTTEATFYQGEGHFIMYSRANEILRSLAPARP